MSLKTIVKVSHISNLSDARYCAGMGVEMLGVGVIPTGENYMPPPVFQDIRGWIAGPKIIAELYGLSAPAEIETVIDTYGPDYFELDWDEYRKFGHMLPLPCIVFVPGGALKTASEHPDEKISFYLVGEETSCENMSAGLPLLLKISSLKSLEKKLAEGCFKGIVLEGPKQSRPGVTNYEQLGDLLEALEEREP